MECCYCGSRLDYPAGTDWRVTPKGDLACADERACDQRDAERDRAELAELRRRRREGDELTEGEAQRLAEGTGS